MRRFLVMLASMTASMVVGAGCGVGGQPSGSATELDMGMVHRHAAALTSALAAGASASYVFPIPDGWFDEVDPLPPPWDPSFPFKGTEELRFLPGFGDGTSAENFSYTYLLWIDEGPVITSASLSSALLAYYQGLICSDPANPCPGTGFDIHLATLLKTRPLEIMTGSIAMLDFVHLPITLNLLASSAVCPASHHRAVLISASPQPYSSPVWSDLLGSQLRFRCR